MADDILLSDVRRLRLEPGDALLVTVPANLSAEQLHRIRATLGDSLPGTRVLVVFEGVDISVLSGATDAGDALGARITSRSAMPPRDPVIAERV